MGKSATSWRNSSQPLMPVRVEPTPPGQYDIYPGFPTGSGQIEVGFDALAERVAAHSTVIIDGFIGVFWSDLRARLDKALKKLGVEAAWIDVARMLKSETEIEALVNPFLGEMIQFSELALQAISAIFLIARGWRQLNLIYPPIALFCMVVEPHWPDGKVFLSM